MLSASLILRPGIRGSTCHPLPRDVGEERHQRRAGILDNGEADQGQVRDNPSYMNRTDAIYQDGIELGSTGRRQVVDHHAGTERQPAAGRWLLLSCSPTFPAPYASDDAVPRWSCYDLPPVLILTVPHVHPLSLQRLWTRNAILSSAVCLLLSCVIVPWNGVCVSPIYTIY